MDAEGLRCDKIADLLLLLLPSCVHFSAETPAVPRLLVFNAGTRTACGTLRHFAGVREIKKKMLFRDEG
jgi:hypothetical protein